MAARFRPILKFDSRERWRPLNVNMLLAERRGGNPIHGLCPEKEESCDPIRGAHSLNGSGADHIDFEGHDLGGEDSAALTSRSATTPSCRGCSTATMVRFPPSTTTPRPRTIVSTSTTGGSSATTTSTVTTPKSFVAARCWARSVVSEHEGDWEGVTAITAPGDPTGWNSSHTHSTRALSGVHSSVSNAKVRDRRLCGGWKPRRVCEELSAQLQTAKQALLRQSPGRQHGWERKTRGRNGADACGRPQACLLPLPRTAWGPFMGFWGSRKCESGRSCRLAQAPRSPSVQQRYLYPWCYSAEERKLACDGQEPTSNSQIRRWTSRGGGNEI